jgi:hypothetical protein
MIWFNFVPVKGVPSCHLNNGILAALGFSWNHFLKALMGQMLPSF